jgi:hypothetical protein
MSERLYPYSHLNFFCDNCGKEFQNKTAYSPVKNAHESDQFITYCSNCVTDEEKSQKKSVKSKQKKKSLEKDSQDNRITGRTRQLNLKVTEETYRLLKKLALKEKCLMTEVVEEALLKYRKKGKN